MKTLADLPLFTILGREIKDKRVVLRGKFNHLETVRQDESWSWLYEPPDSFAGYLRGLERSSLNAFYELAHEHTPSTLEALHVGNALPWIDRYWNSCLVQKILEDTRWERFEFAASDAIAQPFDGGDGKTYTQTTRYQGGPLLPNQRIVPRGWDHEHCTLCQATISEEPGSRIGHRENEMNQILCQSCFEKYARPHDLSFLFPSES